MPPLAHHSKTEVPNDPPRGAFTLVELLVVIAIMAIMLSLMGPALNSLKGASDVTKAAYDIAGFLDQARVYAMTNDTYVYIGFQEADAAKDPGVSPQPAGVGRVILGAVASKDGTFGADPIKPATNWIATYATVDVNNLVAVGKPLVVENLHIATTGWTPPATGAMARQDLTAKSTGTIVGHSKFTSKIQFSLPLKSALGAGHYNFTQWVFVFDSKGTPHTCSSDSLGIAKALEIDLQQTHGNVVPATPANPNSGNQVVIQIHGTTGVSTIYRP